MVDFVAAATSAFGADIVAAVKTIGGDEAVLALGKNGINADLGNTGAQNQALAEYKNLLAKGFLEHAAKPGELDPAFAAAVKTLAGENAKDAARGINDVRLGQQSTMPDGKISPEGQRMIGAGLELFQDAAYKTTSSYYKTHHSELVTTPDHQSAEITPALGTPKLPGDRQIG